MDAHADAASSSACCCDGPERELQPFMPRGMGHEGLRRQGVLVVPPSIS